MLISDRLGDAFLVRRLLLDRGCRAFESDDFGDAAVDLGALAITQGSTVEDIFRSLDKTVLLLNLAGYECREVLVAKPGYGDATLDVGYARIPMQAAALTYTTGDWRSFTGASVDNTVYSVVCLRVTVRRTLGETSPYPPISLDGLPGYNTRPDPDDRLAHEADGWITFGAATLPGGLSGIVDQEAPVVESTLIDALVAAWPQRGDGRAVGLMGILDPQTWEVPLDRVRSHWPFDELAAEIGTHLDDASTLRTFLEHGLDDKEADLKRLHAAANGQTSWGNSIEALRRRGGLLHPNNANLPTLLDRLRKTHWILGLMILHEYRLLGLLPTTLQTEDLIPGSVDLTGSYETERGQYENGREVLRTLHINQAGDYLVGWGYDDQLARFTFTASLDITVYDPESASPGTELAYTGSYTDLDSGHTDTFKLKHIPLLDEDFPSFTMVQGSHSRDIRRRSRRALLDPSDLLSAAGSTDTALEAPLAIVHSAAAQLIDAVYTELVERIEEITTISTSQWGNQVILLEGNLEDMLEDGGLLRFDTDRHPEPSAMLTRFQNSIHHALPRTPIEAAGGVDAWTQLNDICGRAGSSADGLMRLLGLTGSGGHWYQFWISGVGLAGEVKAVFGAELGGFLILCYVRHQEECAAPGVEPSTHGWLQKYGGVMGVGGGSVGAEVEGSVTIATTSLPNDLWSAQEWTLEDFEGAVLVVGEVKGTATAASGAMISAGPNAEGYFLYSNGKWASGKGTGAFVDVGIGAGGGLGGAGGGTVGKLIARIGEDDRPLDAVVDPPEPLDITINATQDGDFDVDSGELGPNEKVHLQRMVARYRALLEDAMGFLQIEGDASPTGDDSYNEDLSWQRSLNAAAYIRSLLTAAPSGDWGRSCGLAIDLSRTLMIGFGEARARLAGVADEVEDDDWRRVKVILSDTILMIL